MHVFSYSRNNIKDELKESGLYGKNVTEKLIECHLVSGEMIPGREIGLKMGDNISTDEILAGGSRVLPYRSNLPEISKFLFEIIDPTYYERAKQWVNKGGHTIVGGFNYGQGSSREHAALAPRTLGLHVALVKDFARIHQQNLINFGVLPLVFSHPKDYDYLKQGDTLVLKNIREKIETTNEFEILIKEKKKHISVRHTLSSRQIEIMKASGLINWVKQTTT